MHRGACLGYSPWGHKIWTRLSDQTTTAIHTQGGNDLAQRNELINICGIKAFKGQFHTKYNVLYQWRVNFWFKVSPPSATISVYVENHGLYYSCSLHGAQHDPKSTPCWLCRKCWNNRPSLPHQILALGEIVMPKREAATVWLSPSREVWMGPLESLSFSWQWEKQAVCAWRIECKTRCKCCLYCLGQIKWLEGLTYHNKKTQMREEKSENPAPLNNESFFDRFNLPPPKNYVGI